MKLIREFYSRDTIVVAKELLGKVLVHEVNGIRTSGKIVEVEAYRGINDKGAHAYGGRRTPRTEALYGPAGHAYVYFIYGLYYCMNVVAMQEGIPEGVLIRAIEPIEGIEVMSERRFKKLFNDLTKYQLKNLTNGPSKLCSAMEIRREQNLMDLNGDELYIEEGKNESFEIVEAKRVGIDYAEEAKDYLWRFYIKGNKCVSVLKKD
ncbi:MULTISPECIES: DNA-3-methyladenine glycosylase [Clostridium]|uniref:Putative 3-methyladenine DNA glycosylase n=1 Tax=Clostridium acetobutylicum (strain ATCC 824 / DSM 792 / JCM 1419 / IAM 19013 / LMG 5710 / NBRC 13948 / NRRL B-527 / VKM B-1787 / 2291 / W) TaxID=272562 RepID=3MGH_CLOAB|nr:MULTISPECIES: DNA-3-methyladenine glycosylase [Clostridium]Q97EY6.1 RecName: Full=Putative 3-methyladenine DNA glycosylase [Clostridium acetobutylicum ATCC 824]AAK80911.1 3-methyladenine DNA glycosylase [Clostridium acetobutylicum ATCC 824]ADZ22013.1 3-methyladenine DNA glycosylase [Clostridium acetobutylicum EA 2018]AEI32628.1 3-methyladenine DNA glycosylase [Clostridium acetobutylicum DSM 1731]AWV78677.1 DNA-3-methyladenine glycosylase [Clostridium acetobutylicum]MBC2393540.1 DNA-3-methy